MPIVEVALGLRAPSAFERGGARESETLTIGPPPGSASTIVRFFCLQSERVGNVYTSGLVQVAPPGMKLDA